MLGEALIRVDLPVLLEGKALNTKYTKVTKEGARRLLVVFKNRSRNNASQKE
jgi:hypothetical protein